MMTNGRKRFMGRRCNWLDVGGFPYSSENRSSLFGVCPEAHRLITDKDNRSGGFHRAINTNIQHRTPNVERRRIIRPGSLPGRPAAQQCECWQRESRKTFSDSADGGLKKTSPSPVRLGLVKKRVRLIQRLRYAIKPNPAPASASSANVAGSGTIVIENEARGMGSSMKF